MVVIQVAQWKATHFLPPPGGLLLRLQQLCHLQLDSLIYSPTQLDFLTASPNENLAVAQKMALVNTKIKYPDDEPDCAQAFRPARRKEKGKQKNTQNPKPTTQETFLFRISPPKQAAAVNTAEMSALESWHAGRHGGGPWLPMKQSK